MDGGPNPSVRAEVLCRLSCGVGVTVIKVAVFIIGGWAWEGLEKWVWGECKVEAKSKWGDLI